MIVYRFEEMIGRQLISVAEHAVDKSHNRQCYSYAYLQSCHSCRHESRPRGRMDNGWIGAELTPFENAARIESCHFIVTLKCRSYFDRPRASGSVWSPDHLIRRRFCGRAKCGLPRYCLVSTFLVSPIK
jgi:hypothetical protein